MKNFKCLDCNETFKVENQQNALETMMPHYMKDHLDMMKGLTEETKEEWMKRFYQQWKETPEENTDNTRQ